MAFIKDGMKRKEANLTFDPKKSEQELTEEELLELQAQMEKLQNKFFDISRKVNRGRITRK